MHLLWNLTHMHAHVQLTFFVLCNHFLMALANPVHFRNNLASCNSSNTYIGENGRTCFPCSPGHYKVADCVSDGELARCAPCEVGTYQPFCNVASTCAPCSTRCHGQRQVVVEKCNRFANAVCRCTEGYYRQPHGPGSSEGVCLAHSPCKPGYGLLEIGRADKDTTCEPCRPGISYSSAPSFEACQNCTVCRHYNKTCIAASDAVCSPGPLASQGTGQSDADTSQANADCTGFCPAIVISILLIIIMIILTWICCLRYVRSHAALHQRMNGRQKFNNFADNADPKTAEKSAPGDLTEQTSSLLSKLDTPRLNKNSARDDGIKPDNEVDTNMVEIRDPRKETTGVEPQMVSTQTSLTDKESFQLAEGRTTMFMPPRDTCNSSASFCQHSAV